MIKPPKLKIDLLEMEMSKQLPNWLAPSQRYSGKHAAARKRNRDKYLANQKAEKKSKK